MKRILLIISLFSLGLVFVDCKKKGNSNDQDSKSEAQILGTRYSRFWHNLTTTPGGKEKVKVDSTKEKSPAVAVLEFEEVTALEKVTEDKKDYLKVRTVTGQEGFAEAKNYTEAFYVVVTSGVPAFRKPTITAGTKGNMDAGAYCSAKEIQGEWANVDCNTAKYKLETGALEDWYDVWIQINDPKFTVNPLLNETAKLYREAIQAYGKIAKGDANAEKLKKDADEKLNRALEKNDALQMVIRNFMIVNGLLDGVVEEAPPAAEPSSPDNPQ